MICYQNGEFNVLILCELQCVCTCEHREGGILENGYCSIDHQQVCHTVHEETKRCLSHGGIGEQYSWGGTLHMSGVICIQCARAEDEEDTVGDV